MKNICRKSNKIFKISTFIFFAAIFYSPVFTQNYQLEEDILESDEALEVFDLKPRSLEYSVNSVGLVSMEVDDELFVPHKTNDGLEIVHSCGTKVTRFFYDNLLRITKKEIWEIRNAENYNYVSSCVYEYSGENFSPSSVTNLLKDKKEIYTYDNHKNLLGKKEIAVVNSKDYVLVQENYSYDSENRILNEKIIENNYSENYKNLKYKFLKEYKYSYNQFGKNVEYYENNVLKNLVKYTGEKEYYSQVYFDGGISIISYYKDSKKLSDKYLQDSKVIREVPYE